MKDTFHKPKKEELLRGFALALRALDLIAKERVTSTGARGMGLDHGTPVESPRGPTKLVNESALPDLGHAGTTRGGPGETMGATGVTTFSEGEEAPQIH